METPDPQLTARQKAVLATVRMWVERHGYPPTVREIADAVGLASPSSVAHHLDTLERLGLIRHEPRGPRTVSMHGSGATRSLRIPLLGVIAAGQPVVAEQNTEEHLVVDADLVGHGTLFALRVRGESMIEAAICDGDIVIVRQQPVADDGDIVAALIGDEATVKVYRRRGGHIELEPRNSRFQTIDGDDAVILGKVSAVIRRL